MYYIYSNSLSDESFHFTGIEYVNLKDAKIKVDKMISEGLQGDIKVEDYKGEVMYFNSHIKNIQDKAYAVMERELSKGELYLTHEEKMVRSLAAAHGFLLINYMEQATISDLEIKNSLNTLTKSINIMVKQLIGDKKYDQST